MKLKVPNCFKEKQNQPSYCNWAKSGNTEEWEVAQARVGPVHVSEDRESQGRVSCILAAHLLLSTCFLLIWFFSVVFKVPSGTSSAQVSKILRSVPSKAIYTGLFKSCAWDHFPEWTGASRSLFFFSSKFGRRGVCNVFTQFRIWFDIFIWNAKMQYVSLWVGKMQNCVSLLSVWFLKRVFKMYSERFFILYYCFGHVALVTFSVPDSQLPEMWGWEALELQQDFCSMSAILHC